MLRSIPHYVTRSVLNVNQISIILMISICCILRIQAIPIDTNGLEEVNCQERRLNSTDCLRAQILFYLQRLKPGLREAEVPSIDPLNIDVSNFFTDKDKLNLNVTVSDVQIQGLSTIDISNINLNLEDGKVEVFGKIAVIQVETDLISEGGILDFPLHGQGHLKLSLCPPFFCQELLHVKILGRSKAGKTVRLLVQICRDENLLGKRLKKGVETHTDDVSTAIMMYYSDKNKMINVIKFMSDFTPSKIVAKFKGKIDDDDKLGQGVNTFLNENSYEIYNDSKSLILRNLDKMFTEIINNALFYHFVRKEQHSLYEGRR